MSCHRGDALKTGYVFMSRGETILWIDLGRHPFCHTANYHVRTQRQSFQRRSTSRMPILDTQVPYG